MHGFDGDPERAAALRSSLEALLVVFPAHLSKPPAAITFDAESRAGDELFEAIVRAHKRDRLGLPVQALRAANAGGHGFTRMPLRRFAWFVPSLLAAWLTRTARDEALGTDTLVAMLDDLAANDPDEGWTDDEAAALEGFFAAALAAAVATPLTSDRPDVPGGDRERPLEDGVRVWSRCSPSLPLDVLRVARAFGFSLEPLVVAWALDEDPLALDHLVEAVFDTLTASKHYLSHEAVADRLGAGFFAATGETASRLSKAEATVRRNIARRGDFED